MKNIIITLIIIILIAAGAYFYLQSTSTPQEPLPDTSIPTETPTSTAPGTTTDQTASSTAMQYQEMTTIGKSVEGRDITAYHYGTGSDEILFVGGIHGAYEWNTSLVAYQLIDYLKANPDAIPANETITVIPVLNPDGLYKIIGKEGRFTASDVTATLEETIPGRFNANNVDLNRNFDCDWQAEGVWQNKNVSGGTAAFSEPESKAARNYVTAHPLTAAVVFYSAAGGVFSSNCHDGVLPETKTLTDLYANASGYKPYESFDFYTITGDMVNWLAKEKIPAISVLLTNHTSTEWDKNKAGIDAVLEHYAK